MGGEVFELEQGVDRLMKEAADEPLPLVNGDVACERFGRCN